MSTLWPHPPYAEDQPHAHTILTTHVLFRGFQSGALLGSTVGLAHYAYRSFRPLSSSPSSTTSTLTTASGLSGSASKVRPARVSGVGFATILRPSSTASLLGILAMSIALPLRMRGREDIEWCDRSWRLLENKGQVEVDSWSLSGAVVGVVAALRLMRDSGSGRSAESAGSGERSRMLRGMSAVTVGMRMWRVALGGAGIGASMGLLGYLGWRYGVMRGRRWNDEIGDAEGVRGAKLVG